MATRNWYCPHPESHGDCGLLCRPNSCLEPASSTCARDAEDAAFLEVMSETVTAAAKRFLDGEGSWPPKEPTDAS